MNDKQKALLTTIGIKPNLNRKEKKIFKSFANRHEEVMNLLAQLPTTRETEQLELRVYNARSFARDREFTEAKKRIKAVLRDVRDARNGYANALNRDELTIELRVANKSLKGMKMELDRATGVIDHAIQEISQTAPVSSCGSVTEMAERLRDLTPLVTQWEVDVADAMKGVRDVAARLKSQPLKPWLDNITLKVTTLTERPGAENFDDAKQAIVRLAKEMNRGGQLLNDASVCEEFDRKETDFRVALAALKDVSRFQTRESDGELLSPELAARQLRAPVGYRPGQKGATDDLNILGGMVDVLAELKELEAQAVAADPESLARKQAEAAAMLQRLEDEGQRRIDRARDRMMGEVGNDRPEHQDRSKHRIGARRRKAAPAPLQRFDLDDVIPADFPTLKDLPPAQAKAAADRVIAGLDAMLPALPPDGDILFDLVLKSPESLKAELASALRIDLKACTDTETQALESLAGRMVARVREAYPHKAATETVAFTDRFGRDGNAPESFTLNGVAYANPRYLSSGGLGHILRYEDQANPGQYVVLKTLVDSEQREEMVNELAMHRHVEGGERGQRHNNVIGLKGAILSPDGDLHMAVEFADGGSMDGVGTSLAQAASAGVLSEEARQVLSQNLFRQAVEGMVAVQARSVLHRDIKELNYLMCSDGTVKVADFGQSLQSKDADTFPKDDKDVTRGYSAPETEYWSNLPLTFKTDTYSLGAMLSRLTSPVHGQDVESDPMASFWNFKSAPGVAALDRLKNAMLDEDPERRPTLEAVQMSAYLASADEDHPPERVQELLRAMMDYSAKVGQEASKQQAKAIELEGKILEWKRKKVGAEPERVKKLDQELETYSTELAQIRQAIQVILERPDVKPIVDALRQANDALLGRGPATAERSSFRQRYETIVRKFGATAQPDQVLTDLLSVVDDTFANGAPADATKAAVARVVQRLEATLQELATAREGVKKQAMELATQKKVAEAKERAKFGLDLAAHATELRSFANHLTEEANQLAA